MLKSIKDNVQEFQMFFLAGGMSSSVLYLYKVRKKKFSFKMFILNIIIAGWVGLIVSAFIPETYSTDMHYAIISIAGFATFPILDEIEKNGIENTLKLIGRLVKIILDKTIYILTKIRGTKE